MIDPHVHLRDWDERDKETILHGLRAFHDAGFHAVCDMPNTSPAITTRELAEKRLHDAAMAARVLETEGKRISYHLYLGLTSDEDQIREMVETYHALRPSVCGLKLFASHSTGDMGIISEEDQEKVWRTLSSLCYDGVVAVHAEKTSLFVPGASTHSLSRPAISEAQSVSDQIAFAEKYSFNGTLHIAHISTRGALEKVREARKRGLVTVTCGATPHHALLNMNSESYILKMNPPLRSEEDRKALWDSLLDGTVDWVESDHAPHTAEDKRNGKCGIPGVEGMLRLFRALHDAGCPRERICALFSENAAAAFGIPATPLPIEPPSSLMIEKAGKEYPLEVWK